jgi:hypothetical protein
MASRSVPETVGRFAVQALLGAGGMGEVYKAIDPTLRRTVAVKTVRPDITNPDYLSRLLREAQACASLHHPNIVTVYEAGEIDGTVYIVMEYLEGEDLAQVLNRGGLTFEERIRTLMQILDALDHAHNKGVIHRDIKPSNVRRLPNGTIKLVDFGLARMTRAETLTATGTVMGTPHYASPEQLQGQSVDLRSDIYSTGTMAYEMCSGRRPFDDANGNITSVMLKVVTEPPPAMNVTWSHTFPEIERIVNRAMAKKREDRYQSAEDMKNAFSAFLSQSRDDIASEQARSSVAATRTVIEAKGLIAAGKTADAQSLLAQTLQGDPHASGVRLFLAEMSTVAVPPPAAPPSTATTPPQLLQDDVTVPVAKPLLEPTIVDQGGSSQRTTMPPVFNDGTTFENRTTPMHAPPKVTEGPLRVAPVDPPKPVTPPKPNGSNTMWWAGGAAAAAAAVVFALIGWPAMQSNDTGTEPAAVTPPAASAPVASSSPAAAVAPAPVNPAPVNPAPVNPPPAPAPTAAAPAGTNAAVTTPAAPPSAPAAPPAAPAPPASSAAKAAAVAGIVNVANANAKSLFYLDAKATPGGPMVVTPTGLRYRMTRQTADGEADVDPATAIFKNGDKVRLEFESNIDGFLYVVTEGSSGRWAVLFPSPEINGGRNSIRKSTEYVVPPDGWFEFEGNPGAENIFVLLSKEQLTDIPGFSNPAKPPEFLNAAAVESMQKKILSRDLSFARDDRPQKQGSNIIQANYVVNKGELGKAVSVSITLNHVK